MELPDVGAQLGLALLVRMDKGAFVTRISFFPRRGRDPVIGLHLLLAVHLGLALLTRMDKGAFVARVSSLPSSDGGPTSLMRCFTFSETSPKTSSGDVFFKTSLEHRTVKQKVRCFYTMF